MASLLGNSVIIHIIREDNSVKTTTNYLILNQACADLLMTLLDLFYISLLGSPSKNQRFGGLFGLITCKLSLAIVFIPAVFSVWILVAIAIERFYAVTRPFRSSPVSKHLKKTILILWIWSVSSSANEIVNGIVGKHEGNNYCYISDTWFRVRFSFGTALNVALPILIISVLYIIVCYKLWSREVPGEGTSQNQRQIEALKTAKKVTRMMIAIVVLYILCRFPLDIYFVLTFGSFVGMNTNMFFFVNWLITAYSALNPYIYLVFNQLFRNKFKDLLERCFRKVTIRQVVPRASRVRTNIT